VRTSSRQKIVASTTTCGITQYYMTGPEGDVSRGYWQWVAVEEGRSFEVRDGFAGEDGLPNAEMPSMRMIFEFQETALGSRVTTTTYFNSADEFEQLKQMGMEEGMRSAMEQIDAVVEDLASFAVGRGTELQLIGDTQARVSRIIRGSVEQVWRAHHDPALLRVWQLGPDGWSMPICEVATEAGGRNRIGWASNDGSQQFGFVGVVAEIDAPNRSVTTEQMWTPEDPEGEASPSTVNELTLTQVEGGTLLVLFITYPDAATREMVLATGMVDGMESSYARLETEVLQA
ncbi:MAG: SRPBCC family protein, partial [Leucobacter sp.]